MKTKKINKIALYEQESAFFCKKLAKIRHLHYAETMNMNKFYFLLAKQRKLEFQISSFINLRAEVKDDDVFLTIENTAKDFESGLLQDKKRITTLQNPSYDELQNILAIPTVQKQINDAYCNKLGVFHEKARALGEMQKIIEHLPGSSPMKRKILSNIFEIATQTNQFRLSPYLSLCVVDICNKAPSRPGDLHFQLKQHIPSPQQKTRLLNCKDIEIVQQVGRIFDKDYTGIFSAVLDEKSKIERRSYADTLIYEQLKRHYQHQTEK